jgi:hypothetical protein
MLVSMIDSIIGSTLAINVLLILLIALDIVLSVLAILFPDTWFKIFHDQPYIDPQGLLRRTGAVWVAFTLLQAIAYIKWQQQPYWLVLVAGVRLTELFSDWAYLYFSRNTTWSGCVSLFVSPPANLVIGWFLIQSFLTISTIK